MRILLSAAFILIAFSSFSQSRKERKAAQKSSEASQPTTLDPGNQPAMPAVKQSKKALRKKSKSSGVTYNSQKEFEQRMDARAKTYRKNEKNMSTPQYVDPKYFGHKRPPKKRPPNKMKYCKVCGLRH